MTERALFDLSRIRRVHVVGIGGPGMSAIALCLAGMGHDVSGSDIRQTVVTEGLAGQGISVVQGHSRLAIAGCDAVTASTSIPWENIELDAAREQGIEVLTRAQILAAICALRPAIGVAGTHGKTTTTSLLVHIFSEVGLKPNFIVGGDVINQGTGGRWDDGQWTIVEADESDGTHLQLPLAGTILTNIDQDHLDHYGTFAGIVEGFAKYLDGIDGPCVVCLDDPVIRTLDLPLVTVTYGAHGDAQFRFHSVSSKAGRTSFVVSSMSQNGALRTTQVSMHLRGLHNVANVTGALAMAVCCGIDLDLAAEAVQSFSGVVRRFEIMGTSDGITFIDDYAHLPREIAAVLTAAKSSGDSWTRIVAVFQPNRYHRMAVMSPEYVDAFLAADLVVVTEIYASGTKKIEGVTGHFVVEAVLREHPETQIQWFPERGDLALRVSELLQPGDVCISMGCGDIETLPSEILALRRANIVGQ